MNRSTSPEVRNPLLAVPGVAEEIERLTPEALAAFQRIATACGRTWNEKGNDAWANHKAPMAAYWKKNAVWARHFARLCVRSAKGRKA